MNTLDHLININTNISLSSSILFFYILLGIPFLSDLYSHQFKSLLTNNRYAKHILGYTTILILISQLSKKFNLSSSLFYSFIAYTWFILTTKLDLHWLLAIIALLVLGFLYEKQLNTKQSAISTDQALDKKEKRQIKRQHKKMKRIIFFSIIFLTVIGSINYFNKKSIQYGGSFDIDKFLFN